MKCIAIDDEPIALEIIECFCKRKQEVDVTTFSDPMEGMEAIRQSKPDLVILDIEMGEISGLQLARKVPANTPIIFTTAFLQYAVEGFNLDAVDYLHKPFTFDRFSEAIEKVKRRMSSVAPSSPTPLTVKYEYNNITVNPDQIAYLQAMENYSKIYLRDGRMILAHNSLKSLLEALPQEGFVQIHRSYAVSRNEIESFTRQTVRLKDGITLPVGRKFSENLFKN